MEVLFRSSPLFYTSTRMCNAFITTALWEGECDATGGEGGQAGEGHPPRATKRGTKPGTQTGPIVRNIFLL